ncbi:hypothetical protein BT69DRAFT_1357005 [Atractiella rhizophila]|nr:hypothetical protein BT69DRAFT_1357005 [Atractiella rhizophila]
MRAGGNESRIRTLTHNRLGLRNWIFYKLEGGPSGSVKFEFRINLWRKNGEPTANATTSIVPKFNEDNSNFRFRIDDEQLSDGNRHVYRDVHLEVQNLPPSPSLRSISVAAFCPVFVTANRSRSCSFDQERLVLWSKGANQDVVPAAVSLSHANLQLQIDDVWSTSSVTWTILGQFRPASESKMQFPNFSAGVGESILSCSIPKLLNNLPFGFKGFIDWEIKSSGDLPITRATTAVEIYILSPHLPKFILDGVPALLLQFLVLPIDRSFKDESQTWVDHVVNFFRPQDGKSSQIFQYESNGGMSNYTGWPGPSGKADIADQVSTSCYIEHFLQHIKNQKANRSRWVNCYDLAGLGQTMLSLGLDESVAKLRMMYLYPFGYINKTSLIGVDGWCNSPFPPDGKSFEVDQLDPKRSSFGNHAFLTLDRNERNGPKVVDITCGPQKAQLTLRGYIDAAIDHDATAKFQKAYEAAGRKGRAPAEDGHFWNLRDGPGVTRLVSPVDFRLDAKGGVGVLAAIEEALPDGDLDELDIHFDGVTMNANWHFYPAGVKDEDAVRIDLFAINDSDKIYLEYVNRSKSLDLDGTSEEIEAASINTFVRGTKGTTSDGQPFAVWSHKKSGRRLAFLFVLKGMPLLEELNKLINPIQQAVDDYYKESPPDPDLSLRNASAKSLQMGTTFSVEVICRTDTVVGSNVDTMQGNVVFLRAEQIHLQQGTGSKMRYTFYARRTGLENIILSFYDAHLQFQSISYFVEIVQRK